MTFRDLYQALRAWADESAIDYWTIRVECNSNNEGVGILFKRPVLRMRYQLYVHGHPLSLQDFDSIESLLTAWEIPFEPELDDELDLCPHELKKEFSPCR